VEAEETIEEALRRETREELGAELLEVRPLTFRDARLEKLLPDGSRRQLYMVFLLYECTVASGELALNVELSAAEWVELGELARFDLNPLTVETFRSLGWLAA